MVATKGYLVCPGESVFTRGRLAKSLLYSHIALPTLEGCLRRFKLVSQAHLCEDVLNDRQSDVHRMPFRWRVKVAKVMVDSLKGNKELEPGRWYSAREAAAYLEVTELTVTRYCRDGILKGKKIGPKGRWHVPGSEIARLRRHWGLETKRGDLLG